MEVTKLFDVKDKVVLVTGGAKGIGLMISTGFITNGAKVYISSRDAPACTSAAASLNALGPGTAIALPADLLRLSECERLAAELRKREPGGLHVLVNNSGIAWGAPLDEFPDEQWGRVLTLNLQRVFTLTQLLLPLLESAGVGGKDKGCPAAVINIGSIDALRVPLLENYSYSASKAALHHLGRVLSTKLGPRGITVNTLACGPFATKMTAFAMKTMRDEIEESNPMGRIGEPADVAGACIFLASRAGSFINGATITVDGGVSNVAKL
ncbi:short chain dehydrogenase/reductase family [Pseudomassariella vexata]|uniref:Short chain dehydrogenase/reductase family n=1 Tax=Pseudomassariella vexata TaxID=1141098 RepID=A0A1Y2EB08_9PEZI|nr:short chain dehydrogenase/reductase family [Pseudomassariella vexata]ORY68748.1 short chain dehydrogenase/reductase family [Pseudomassariella vexata]